ncbi:unnamed protein product, partial [Didymodactylos carnosus]
MTLPILTITTASPCDESVDRDENVSPESTLLNNVNDVPPVRRGRRSSFVVCAQQVNAHQEVAEWVDEDVILNLFDLNVSRLNINEYCEETFLHSSLDLTKSNFNPYYYLLAYKSHATVDELRTDLIDLKRRPLGTLVKQNILPFIEAIDMLSEIKKESVEKGRIEDILSCADALHGTGLQLYAESIRIRNALKVIPRYDFLFSIDRNLKQAKYKLVINDLAHAPRMVETLVNSKSLKSLFYHEIDRQLDHLQSLFSERLLDETDENQILFIRYLQSVGRNDESEWCCLQYQRDMIVTSLTACATVAEACNVLISLFPHYWRLSELVKSRSEEITYEIIQTFRNVVLNADGVLPPIPFQALPVEIHEDLRQLTYDFQRRWREMRLDEMCEEIRKLYSHDPWELERDNEEMESYITGIPTLFHEILKVWRDYGYFRLLNEFGDVILKLLREHSCTTLKRVILLSDLRYIRRSIFPRLK